MSVKMMDALWRRTCEAQRKLLLMAYCDCADDEGRAFPSQHYLAWKTDLARSTITQYLKEFHQSGLLEVLGRRSDLENSVAGNSDRNTTVVRVNLDKLETKKPWKIRMYGDRTSECGTADDGCRTSGENSRNKEEPSLEPSGGTPPDLHPMQYATKLLEDVGMTHVRANQHAVMEAINLLVREGKSKASAYEFLLAEALDAIERGEIVDKWWFEDAKWKRPKKSQPKIANAADEARQQLADERARERAHAAGN